MQTFEYVSGSIDAASAADGAQAVCSGPPCWRKRTTRSRAGLVAQPPEIGRKNVPPTHPLCVHLIGILRASAVTS